MDKPSVAEELERLYDLLEKGALTQAEYDMQKAKLLNESPDNNDNPQAAMLPEYNDEYNGTYTNPPPPPTQPYIVQNTATMRRPVMQEPPKRNNAVWFIALFFLVLVIVGAVAWFYTQPKREPTVMVTAASDATSASAPKANNNLSPEDVQKALFDARKLNTTADTQLNTVWNELDSDLKTALKKEQAAWLRQKESDCRPMPDMATPQNEISRLSCETDMINERIDILNEKQAQLLPQVKNAKLKALADQATGALAALNRTWAALPDDVQQQLGQGYNQWAEQTNSRCADASTSDSQVQQKIDYNKCLISAVKAKNNELKGYKINN